MLLTDSNYGLWGSMPNKYNLTTFTTFAFADCKDGVCHPSDAALTFSEKSSCENTTLTAGNTSKLQFFKAQELVEVNSTGRRQVSVPNVGLSQNLMRERQAPAQRVIPLLFHRVFGSLVDFLPLFYTRTISLYKMGDPAFRASLYQQAGLSAEQQARLEQDRTLGMG